jgi:YD repeat-containing protein
MIVFVVFAFLRMAVFRPETPGPQGHRETVTVQRVLDGDTLDLTDGRRIRLLGIDAPEMSHEDQRAEPYSQEATDWLRSRIEGASVSLRIDSAKKDRYGRTLAWVYDEQGRMLNEELLAEGLVRLLTDFGLPADLEPQLRQAESEARILKKGLWSVKAGKKKSASRPVEVVGTSGTSREFGGRDNWPLMNL